LAFSFSDRSGLWEKNCQTDDFRDWGPGLWGKLIPNS
jgi:hypothetical protein